MAGAVLTYLKELRPENKAGFAFGSYGWGRGAPEAIEEYFKSMKWNIINESIKSRYKPTSELLNECRTVGRTLGEKEKNCSRYLR